MTNRFRKYDPAIDGPKETPPSPEGRVSPPEHAFPSPPAAAAYHGLAGEFVRAIEPHVEADPVALLATFLALYGAAIGPNACAWAGDDEHPARLYVALVGRTSRARKGSSWNPARKRLEAVDASWARTSILSGLASGEGLINAVRDAKDGAAEGAKHILAFEPELARVLQAARRDGSTLSAVIRDAWDRTTLRVMTRGDPLQATGAHVGIVAHITRHELLKDVDAQAVSNGFANRFLWIAAERKRLLPHARGSQPVAWDDFNQRLETAVGFGRHGRRLEWDKPAMDPWEKVYADLAADDPPGRIGHVLARSDAQVLRLTVAYSLLDLSPVLTVEALEAAVALWTYAAASARWAFCGGGDGGPGEELRAWIAKRGSRVTARDVTRGLKRYRGDPEGAELELQRLVQAGQGVWEWKPSEDPLGRGRPTRCFRLVTNTPLATRATLTDIHENGSDSVISSTSHVQEQGLTAPPVDGPWNGFEPPLEEEPGEIF